MFVQQDRDGVQEIGTREDRNPQGLYYGENLFLVFPLFNSRMKQF